MSTATPASQNVIADLAKHIDQATGVAAADLAVKNVELFNLDTNAIRKTDIAICGDRIVGIYGQYEGRVEISGDGLIAVPGFINAHGHVESSLLTPLEYDRCVLSRGTTAFICDPHEISNVLGEEGLKYFLDSSMHTAMDLFVQLSSCVPATDLETAGGVIDLKTLTKFIGHFNSLGLAEFMDIGAVMRKDPKALAKLALYARDARHVCGHMPGIRDNAIINALAAVGIRNDHESTSYEEALAKLERGIFIIARLGTVCKDVPKLGKLMNHVTGHRVGLCTDDLKVADIVRHGDINNAVRTAIVHGADVLSAYRASSLNTAEHFGLRDRGRIAAGYLADIVLLSDLKGCAVHSVIKNGQLVTGDLFAARQTVVPVGFGSVKLKIVSAADFVVPDKHQQVWVGGLIPDQIITRALRATLTADERGELQSDLDRDILKLAVLERHGINGNIALGWVHGFGIKKGAIASTHGHDSHNLTVVGSNDSDMAVAVNHLREIEGGFVAVQDGRVIGDLALPVAGLMADPGKPYEQVARELLALTDAVKLLSPAVENPILNTAFMPLSVIPEYRVSDCGPTLFMPDKGDIGPWLIADKSPGGDIPEVAAARLG